MTTLTVQTVPTPDINIHVLAIDFSDFDPHDGVTFICTFLNASNMIIDRKNVTMGGVAWQDWGPTEDPQADYDYVINYCLQELNIQRKPVDPVDPVDPVNQGG